MFCRNYANIGIIIHDVTDKRPNSRAVVVGRIAGAPRHPRLETEPNPVPVPFARIYRVTNSLGSGMDSGCHFLMYEEGTVPPE